MGAGMFANLQSAQFNARGYDIRPLPGIQTDIAPFCDGLTTLVSVVRDADETDNLLWDDQQLIDRAPSLQTIMICSTLSPNYVKSLRPRVPAHINLIDAPMSGAQIKADQGTLTFITGGDTDAIQPLLNAMGDTVQHMGDYGSGMTAKVLNNLLAASNTAMTRLVLDWGDAAGVDEAKLLQLINTASGQNWLASGFNQIEFARDGYAPDNTIGILIKDVAAALDIAPDGDAALPKQVQTVLRNLTPRAKP